MHNFPLDTIRITISVRPGGHTDRCANGIYFLYKKEPQTEEEIEAYNIFIQYTIMALTQDFCIKNNVDPEDTIPKIEKFTITSRW